MSLPPGAQPQVGKVGNVAVRFEGDANQPVVVAIGQRPALVEAVEGGVGFEGVHAELL